MAKMDYKTAGVDIEAGNDAVRRIKKTVEATFSSAVLSHIGSFGALYDLKQLMADYHHPILVQSIDGVGTKMIVARMMGKYDTIGMDLVSATTNDIIVHGAKPLTLLDYIAADKIKPEVIEEIVTGMAKACQENGISLVGGETAEMPDTYLSGEHDLVGIVTGVVEKDKAILGQGIAVGDVILAFPSSGLHTNGYSLARKIIFDVAGFDVHHYMDELGQTIGEALLVPHINYTRPVHALLDSGVTIKGMAHISGGGLMENIPRILPDNCAAEISKSACPFLPLFDLLGHIGEMEEQEKYRTFNMGVGLIMIVSADQTDNMHQTLQDYPDYPVYDIGRIIEGPRTVRLIR